MDLLSYVRSAVSKDKIRFRDGQYDLVSLGHLQGFYAFNFNLII